VKRHSAKLVEAAFDGEVDEVTSWLEKGYYVDSCDGRKNTALSEAACQGHDEVVRLLLQQVRPSSKSKSDILVGPNSQA
jgi:ankyrin repeat protein